MDPAEQMITEWQLTSLSQRFAYYLDNAEFDALAQLFVEDGVFDRGAGSLRGHAAILQAMGARPAFTTRHLLTNFYYTDVTADSANGVVGGIVFHGPVGDGPVDYATENGRVLEFHDRYVRSPEGWRIDSRVVRPIFQPKVWP